MFRQLLLLLVLFVCSLLAENVQTFDRQDRDYRPLQPVPPPGQEQRSPRDAAPKLTPFDLTYQQDLLVELLRGLATPTVAEAFQKFGKRDGYRPLQFGKREFRPLQFGKRSALGPSVSLDELIFVPGL